MADIAGLSVSDLRDEPITCWADMSPDEADHWAGADLDGHPWRRGPLVRSPSDTIAAVRLGKAIAFVALSLLPGPELSGIRIRTIDGLSPSVLEIGVSARTVNPVATQFADHVGVADYARTPGPRP